MEKRKTKRDLFNKLSPISIKKLYKFNKKGVNRTKKRINKFKIKGNFSNLSFSIVYSVDFFMVSSSNKSLVLGKILLENWIFKLSKNNLKAICSNIKAKIMEIRVFMTELYLKVLYL